MPDLSFRIEEVTTVSAAAVPTIAARLHLANALADETVRSVSLNCQVRIHPSGRPYTALEEARLLDLFGERERWGRTMQPLLWHCTTLNVPGFVGEATADLLLPCTLDFDVAAAKYFYGLEAGEIAISVLFSGTAFYTRQDGALQVAPIPWDREAKFRLPVQVWQEAIRAHYGDAVWLRLPKESFDRLYRFKTARGVVAWDRLIHELLDRAERAELQPEGTAAGAAR